MASKVDNLIEQVPNHNRISFWLHAQNKAENLEEILKERNFQRVITCSLMSCTPQHFTIKNHMILPANTDVFHDILAKVFHFDEVVANSFMNLLQNVPCENYLIYLDHKPVGAGTIMPNKKVGGIFNVSILPEFQRKGLGRTMVQFLMNRAYKLGHENLVLLSSPESKNLYTQLNFKNCFDIEIYA